MPKTCKISLKRRNFAKSGHTSLEWLQFSAALDPVFTAAAQATGVISPVWPESFLGNFYRNLTIFSGHTGHNYKPFCTISGMNPLSHNQFILRICFVSARDGHCCFGANSFQYFAVFFKNGQTRPFCLFLFFSHDKYSTNLTINDKSIYGLLGTRTRAGGMVGTNESTELWRHSCHIAFWLVYCKIVLKICQSRFKSLPNNKPSKLTKEFKKVTKMAKFRQIWSHWTNAAIITAFSNTNHVKRDWLGHKKQNFGPIKTFRIEVYFYWSFESRLAIFCNLTKKQMRNSWHRKTLDRRSRCYKTFLAWNHRHLRESWQASCCIQPRHCMRRADHYTGTLMQCQNELYKGG